MSLFPFHFGNSVSSAYCFTHVAIYFKGWLGELISSLQVLEFGLNDPFGVTVYNSSFSLLLLFVSHISKNAQKQVGQEMTGGSLLMSGFHIAPHH